MSQQYEFEDIQIMRYMGSKRNILPHVVQAIMKVHDPKKSLCDLMAGTNSVSYAIKTLKGHSIPIISNDVQICSATIAKALIENNSISTISLEDANKDLKAHFDKNLSSIDQKWDNKFILKNQYRTKKKINLSEQFFKKEPYCLFTFYFTNVFFSLEQCKEIDSLRYAIENVHDPVRKSIYLTCLIYAVSYGNSSFGHFAQPRRYSSEVRKIRKKSIYDLFTKKLQNLSITSNKVENKCFNKNYKDLFLDQGFLSTADNIGTVYLDPPYSPANYSRFYHVLETLIRYDYPKNEHKGLYRNNRFLSNFCKISTVRGAFRDVIKFAYERKANLVISYSNTGLLKKRAIKKLCREYYRKRAVWHEKDIHHKHSTQGNRRKNGVKEILIICKNHS